MMKTLLPLLVLPLLATMGCGDGGAAVLKRRHDLQQLGFAYREYHKVHSVAPSDAGQLLTEMRKADPLNSEAASAATSLEEGDITMIWNGQLDKLETPSQYVLGFEAGVPAHGGYVVLADGDVQLMKRGEFDSATLLPASR